MNNFRRITDKFLITLVLIYTTLWFVERWLFENILEKAIQKAADNGIKISYVSSSASGFPDDLVFHLRSVNVKFRDLVEMNSPGMNIKAGLLFPFKQHFQISLENITQGTFFKNFKFTTFQMHIKVFLEKMDLQSLKVVAGSLVAMYNQTPIIEMKPFRMQLANAFDDDIPILHFSFQSSMKSWYGESFVHTALDVDTKFQIYHYKILLNSPYPLHSWREKAGKILINKFQTRGKQVDFQGTGVISLDKNLFPEGNIALKMQGVEPFSNFIQKSLQLKNEKIGLLHFGLEGFFKKDAEGYTVVPLILKNGKLSFGGISLLSLPNLQ